MARFTGQSSNVVDKRPKDVGTKALNSLKRLGNSLNEVSDKIKTRVDNMNNKHTAPNSNPDPNTPNSRVAPNTSYPDIMKDLKPPKKDILNRQY